MSAEITPQGYDFLTGGGEMGALMRAHDWSGTSLGNPGAWPQGLRTAVRLMLNTGHPIYIFWGADGACLYNDAYRPSLGPERHPGSLGRPAREVWGEIWSIIGPQLDQVLSGRGATWDVNALIPMTRQGVREDVYWTYSYSPLDDEGAPSGIGGVLTICTETTEQIRNAKRLADSEERLASDLAGMRRLYDLHARLALETDLAIALREIVKAAAEFTGTDRGTVQLVSEDGARLEIVVDHGYAPGSQFVEHFRYNGLKAAPDAIWQQQRLIIEDTRTFLGLIGTPEGEAALAEGVLATQFTPMVTRSGKMVGVLGTQFPRPHRVDKDALRLVDLLAWTAADFVERHRAEAALRESEAKLRELNATLEVRVEERTRERDQAWRNSQDLQVVVSTSGVFQAANEAWTAILGWRPDEVVGRSHLDFVHPSDHPSSEQALATATEAELPVYENRCRHRDGTYRWISWVAAPEDDLIYASGRHVTAEKEADAALAAMQEQLRQSQKMEAVGQLTGGLAHDFNNLLAGISGSLELMQARVAQGRVGELDRYLGAAQGAAKRAAALTHRLLAFSRRQTLDPRPTNANRLAVDMEELIRRTVGPMVTVEVAAAGGLWATLVDPNQLENALLNLCINARDAMPGGGRLTIETGNRWLDQGAARERDLPPGQYVSVCVSDTGTGMKPEVTARAFDPFFTTKPIGMGTGLGLSMVYGFVRQSGGQARIYSEPGQGTMVCLYLPRHHGEAEGAEVSSEPAEAPRAEQGETVLVVDDEPTVRMLVTEVLGDLGYTAIEAADGPAGLRVLQSDARIDLLVTDVGLPGGMNGRQMADAARERRPGLRVLFITGYAENAVLNHGHLDPGMHVMTKPFAMEALANRIKELFAGP